MEVLCLPTLELCNEMEGLLNRKMGSIKAPNKVIRFDYGKLKGKDIAFCI